MSEPQKKRKFLDVPMAAEMAGYCIRHFRRIMEEENIPVMQIRHKQFILARDFDAWRDSRKQLAK